MLMRSNAQVTSVTASAREVEPAGRLTVRERIVETGDWTIAIPAIATLSVVAERRQVLSRGVLLAAAGVIAFAGLANYAVPLVTPALPILVAAVALLAACALFCVRRKSSYVLALTASDGSRCSVASHDLAKLHEIRAFLAEKINRQDCGACRVFRLDGDREIDGALGANDPLRALSERLDGVAVATHAAPPVVLVPIETGPANADTSGGIDYASVLAQVTDLHRFYEKHPQAVHIRERLSEMELLMRSGTPSATQRGRMRALSLDLSNIMAAYPHMTQLFSHVTSLASR